MLLFYCIQRTNFFHFSFIQQMPKVIPLRGTQFKRVSARVHEQSQQSQFKHRKISKPIVPIVDTELNPICSQAGSHVSNLESIRSPNSNPWAIAVTPDSPPSPPIIKIRKKNDLFDTMSLLSATSYNENDEEEIDQ
jgi:hypothetical protein